MGAPNKLTRDDDLFFLSNVNALQILNIALINCYFPI